jgi:hypothetical protein
MLRKEQVLYSDYSLNSFNGQEVNVVSYGAAIVGRNECVVRRLGIVTNKSRMVKAIRREDTWHLKCKCLCAGNEQDYEICFTAGISMQYMLA